MIPRLIHQFWAGPNPRPDCSSWDLPGWEHQIWTPETIDYPLPQWSEPEAFTMPWNNPAERMKANVARFELLGDHGGIWADADIELVGDLERLLVGSCNLAMHGDPPQVGTAFIAAEPGHPFVESCRSTIRALDHPVAAPSMFAANRAPRDQVTFLDPQLVYPGPYWADGPAGVEPTVLRNHPRRS